MFVAKVTEHFGIPIIRLFSPTRDQDVVEVRQCIWHVLYTYEKKNYTALGRYFKRDHATVLYGVKKVDGMLKHGDDQIKKIHNEVISIYKQLKNG